MNENKLVKKPSYLEIFILLSLFLIIAVSFTVYFDLPIQLALFIGLFLILILGVKLGYSYKELQSAMNNGIYSGLEAVLILVAVGALIGTWITGGIVPTIIYYGLEFIHPSIFLLATLILCSVTALATGTSWGTAGTVGIAMIGVGGAMGIPLPLVVGAILSGAYFGDKLSPLSDSTVLTASMSKVDVMEHVRSLLYVSIPALVISGIVFTIVGFSYVSDTVDLSRVESIMTDLNNVFHIHWFMLIPPIIVIALLVMKKPAMPTISFGALLGVIWAVLFQDIDVNFALKTVYDGFVIQSGNEFIDDLLNRGGIGSMLDSVVVIILGLGFGGLLSYIGVIEVLMSKISKLITNAGRLSFATVFTGLLTNIYGCAMYVSIILTSKTMENEYDRLKVDRRILSRNTEVGGTLTSGMVPWTDNGIFMATLFGVPTLQYLPYMWLNFAAIILAIIYGYTNKFIWYRDEAKSDSVQAG